MRYGLIAENLLERLVLASGLVPTPLIDGYAAANSRVVMVATRLGLFDALAEGPLSAADVAARSGTDAAATEKLLNMLVGMHYVAFGDDRYRLRKTASKWLVSERKGNVRDSLLMKYLEWEWLEGLDDFVRSGEPLEVHDTMSVADWGLYQRGMRSNANLFAPEVARRAPVPDGAREMLDIGGSHGYFSVELCRRHPGLRATVLDLPQAIEHAAPLLQVEGMADRVTLRAGDALSDDLGTDAYDLVLIFSLVHHFDDATNRRLVAGAARALRPGGRLVIGDAIRPSSPGKGGSVGAFFDLYFALTSRSGTWSYAEMAAWQEAAGLRPFKPIPLRMAQGTGLQVAERPA